MFIVICADYKEHHTDVSVRFVVNLPESKMTEALASGLHAKFKLTTKVSTSNMMLFDSNGVIKKYDTPEEILKEFFHLRMAFYVKRKAALLKAAEAELLRISNKVRFILAVISGSIKLNNRKRADVEADLEGQGFDRLPSTKKQQVAAAAAAAPEEEEDPVDASGSYEYLLSMSLSSLTLEKVNALQEEAEERRIEVERLCATTEAAMWRDDLDAFAEAYADFEEEHAQRESQLARQQARAIKGQSKKGGKAAAKGKGKKKNEWSDDESDFESSEDEFDSDNEAPRKKKVVKKVAAPVRKAVPAPVPVPVPPPKPAASQATSRPAAAKKAAAPKAPKAAKSQRKYCYTSLPI